MTQDLVGKIVLLVEDDVIVGMVLEDMFLSAGASVLGPLATAGEALKVLGNFKPDVATLDWTLRGGTSAPVAEALDAAKVPYLFITGNARDDVARHFPGRTILEKPLYDFDALIAKVAGLIPPRSP